MKNYTVQGEGPAVVLLHGSMATKGQWQQLTGELEDGYRVIAMDLSGYGATPFPSSPENYSLADESVILEEILENTLDPDESYHLVGHSYGGAVAFRHAYHQRDRVRGLIAIEPMAYHVLEPDNEYLLASRGMVAQIEDDIRRGDSIDGARKFIDLWLPPGTFVKLSDEEKAILGRGVRKMVLDFYAASTEPLSVQDYAGLDMPINLIAGKMSPPYALCITEHIARHIPGDTLHWVDGGHFSPVSHAHQVNPLIKRFLGSH